MLADWIISEYEEMGYFVEDGNLYLPLTISEDFVYDCTRLNVAIVGVNYILWTEHDFFLHTGSMDLTELLPSFPSWEDLVNFCNQTVLENLEQERETNPSVFFVPVLLEEYEWIMKKMMRDFTEKIS